jgi:hypothetical protein
MRRIKPRTSLRWQISGGRAAYGAVARGQRNYHQTNARKLHVGPPPLGGGKMTTEVAIVNRHAIALAADSAVTVGRERVWKYANKLFSCGPHNDIGIMIYNAGVFVGVPWETIVKEFRAHCGSKTFDRVTDFSDHFIDFIKSEKLSDADEEFSSFGLVLYNVMDQIKDSVNSRISRKADSDFGQILAAALAAAASRLKSAKKSFTIDRARFDATYADFIKTSVEELFKPRTFDQASLSKLTEYLFEWLSRERASDFSSGIVIAGYGAEELFPYIAHFEVDGRALDCTRIWLRNSWNYNKGSDKTSGGRIIPFAQSDMLYLFMEGISIDYINFLRSSIGGILTKKSKSLIENYVKGAKKINEETAKQDAENKTIHAQLFEEFDAYRQENTVDPIMSTITSLPKEEMASMAEALVELTALKRKVGPTIESVGGPVDVAIISKGDGFIWIKRKHYFKPEYNLDFSERKKLRLGRTPT